MSNYDPTCPDDVAPREWRRIRALEARIAIWERCWDNIKLHQPGLREDNKPLAVAASYESLRLKLEHTVDEYDEKLAAELALRQTAEAYAARNALRVIEVDADNEWLREGLRGIAKMDIKTEADRMVLWAKDTLSGRATDLPQTGNGLHLRQHASDRHQQSSAALPALRCGNETMSVPIWINGIAYLPAVECETRVNILEAALREMKKHLRGEVYDTIVLGELIDNALPQTETTAQTVGSHPGGGPCIHVWALTNRSAIENGKCELCGNIVPQTETKGEVGGN